jgi:hypothetical protein
VVGARRPCSLAWEEEEEVKVGVEGWLGAEPAGFRVAEEESFALVMGIQAVEAWIQPLASILRAGLATRHAQGWAGRQPRDRPPSLGEPSCSGTAPQGGRRLRPSGHQKFVSYPRRVP